MVLPSLMSLFDLCGIHIAYLMWIRRDVARKCWKRNDLDNLEKAVLTDFENLIQPEEVKSRLLKHLRPAGERLVSFLSLWLSKLPPKTPQKWLIGYMLFDCLILNADGLINQRKTAQTLLKSKMLHTTLAFRLACINFLEYEVLKLWILVKVYFLNKIVLEGDQANLSIANSYENELNEKNASNPSFPRTSESEEVLFWITYCLSKENEIDRKCVPHVIGNYAYWYGSLFESAALSGNVACFDYFKNFCKTKFECSHLDMIKKIFNTGEGKGEQPFFIFHFMLLNLEEKAKLFQEFPINTVFQFLQWPLSQTFLNNTEEVWSLIPNEKLEWAFKKLSEILINENILLNPFDGDLQPFADDDIDRDTVTYCVEHILSIWIALWNIRSRSYKKFFLHKYVFTDFEYYDNSEDFEEGSEEDFFSCRFASSGLKQKLLDLFLSKIEALFELYGGENVKESLRSLVAKYMPEDFHNIDRECISFLDTNFLHYGMLKKKEVKKMTLGVLQQPRNLIDRKFLNYIKQILFSSYRN